MENNWKGSKEFSEPIKMTSKEFVLKTKTMLKNILDEWSNSHSRKFDTEDDSEENVCDRCGGYAQIEQGGDIVDCNVCDGTGQNNEVVFDTESFLEFITHTVIFGSEPFYELMECELVDKKTNKLFYYRVKRAKG